MADISFHPLALVPALLSLALFTRTIVQRKAWRRHGGSIGIGTTAAKPEDANAGLTTIDRHAGSQAAAPERGGGLTPSMAA